MDRNFANVSCNLKVNIQCESCQKKIMEVLHSIRGVYAITIDAEKGIANVCGEVDPNRLLLALLNSGQHAELINVKLNHPSISNNQRNYGHIQYGYNNNNNNNNALDGTYGYNALECEPNTYYPSRRRARIDNQPYYGSTYHNSPPYDPNRESSSYLYRPPLIDHVIREEPINWCSIL
ncbi:hypothetical protein P3S67_032407 [Capsicum chacoense]